MITAVAPAVFATAVMAASLLLVEETVFRPSGMANFVALVILGGLTYLAGLTAWALVFKWNPRELLGLALSRDRGGDLDSSQLDAKGASGVTS